MHSECGIFTDKGEQINERKVEIGIGRSAF